MLELDDDRDRLHAADLTAAMSSVQDVHVSEVFIRDCVELVNMTRSHDDIGLSGNARAADGGGYLVEVSTRRFAYCVSFESAGFDPDEQYFSLAPGETRHVLLKPSPGSRPRSLQGHVTALNSVKSAVLRLAM